MVKAFKKKGALGSTYVAEVGDSMDEKKYDMLNANGDFQVDIVNELRKVGGMRDVQLNDVTLRWNEKKSKAEVKVKNAPKSITSIEQSALDGMIRATEAYKGMIKKMSNTSAIKKNSRDGFESSSSQSTFKEGIGYVVSEDEPSHDIRVYCREKTKQLVIEFAGEKAAGLTATMLKGLEEKEYKIFDDNFEIIKKITFKLDELSDGQKYINFEGENTKLYMAKLLGIEFTKDPKHPGLVKMEEVLQGQCYNEPSLDGERNVKCYGYTRHQVNLEEITVGSGKAAVANTAAASAAFSASKEPQSQARVYETYNKNNEKELAISIPNEKVLEMIKDKLKEGKVKNAENTFYFPINKDKIVDFKESGVKHLFTTLLGIEGTGNLTMQSLESIVGRRQKTTKTINGTTRAFYLFDLKTEGLASSLHQPMGRGGGGWVDKMGGDKESEMEPWKKYLSQGKWTGDEGFGMY